MTPTPASPAGATSPRGLRLRLARMPLRVRLTLAFIVLIALVLAATGTFLSLRLARDLDAAIDLGLRAHAQDVTTSVQQTAPRLASSGASQLTEQGESIAQVLRLDGTVLDGTPALRSRPLLSAAQRAATAHHTIFADVPRTAAGDDPARLLATRTRAAAGPVIVVVGASVEGRDEALSNLTGLLLIGGPAALLLASLAGYALAAAALRPVERMRRQADAIQTTTAGERLTVPPASDEIGRLATTLNAMLDRLETSFARERTFVADASHELRTPLSILKAELELALRPGRGATEREEALRSAAEETERLVNLAEDLLVVARSDHGELRIVAEPADAAILLGEAGERFAALAHQAGITISVDSPPAIVFDADASRLAQALDNLLDNALRSGAREVRLSARAVGDTIHLAASDDGPGFPPELLATAFQRFARADASRSRGGAGLGLSIVDAIATAHDGTAGVRNLTSGGAEVWLRIPRHHTPPEAAA